MVSFLMMLPLVPLEWGIAWIYGSSLHRISKYYWLKGIVKMILAILIGGGLLAQLGFIAQREPSAHARHFYIWILVLIEAFPVLAILSYRYYQDPSSFNWFDGSDRAKRSPKSR